MADEQTTPSFGLTPADVQSNAQMTESQSPFVFQKLERASRLIVPYLLDRVAEYRELNALRLAGWNSPQGDLFFKRQRQNADTCDEKTAYYFYTLMKKIAEELHKYTSAFGLHQGAGNEPPRVLDMCMAPGGFLEAVLKHNPTSHALAFSLPVSDGGYKPFLPANVNVQKRFIDITMLAEDMGLDDIPQDHPDVGNFHPRQLESNEVFDLAICDGQVLRTHIRASYRENREARRLVCSQLALGLEHLKPGGKMVVLLHKLEAWDTISLLRTFHEFSSVKLFKPRTGHAKRSSFYMVATGVQSDHPSAVRAVERWKMVWKTATFGSEEECREVFSDRELSVEQVLEQFGEELIRLGRGVWKVQADALACAPFIRGRVGVSGPQRRF